MYVYIYVYIYIYIHIYTHIHIHTHIYIYISQLCVACMTRISPSVPEEPWLQSSLSSSCN